MHFTLIHLALSFLAFTTSVVTAPVAVETDDTSALSFVEVPDKRAYYYYSGTEQPAEKESAEKDNRAYYYYTGPEQPEDVEKRAYYYYAGPKEPAKE